MADGSITYTQFTNYLYTTDLSASEKTKLTGIFGQYFHYGLRTFSYSSAGTVSTTAPTCVPAFARSFDHQDWRDGEDLVQAGGVQGFNIRFNMLKADLDHIKTDLEHAFQCLAALRSSVASALSEIKDQLNLINKDIYDCCNGKIDEPVRVDPPVVYYPPFDWTKYATNPDLTLPVNTGDPAPWEKYEDKTWINALDPNEAIIKGKAGTRIDTMTLHGKAMDVWQTNVGLVLADAVNANVKGTFTPGAVVDIKTISTYFAEKAPDFQQELPQNFRMSDFVAKFGNDVLPDGSKVAEAVKDIPVDKTFVNVGDLQNSLIDAHVESIVSSGQEDATLIGTLGLHTSAQPANIAVSSVKGLDAATVTALNKAGLNTVGKLATADPAVISAAIGGNVGNAGAIGGLAKTMVKLGLRL